VTIPPNKTEKQKVKQRERRANGLCQDCGTPTNGKCLCEPHRLAHNERYKKRVQAKKDLGLCPWCSSPSTGPNLCSPCNQRMGQYNRQLRKNIIVGYGGSCARCGETNEIVLDLDHVKNDGKKDRSASGSGSFKAYRKARDSKFSSDYQLLCRNCNWLKHRLGGVLPPPEPISIGVCNAYSN
jgi:hypothetical protein